MNLEELGARLRDKRMEQGLSIEDIAGRLKVPPRVLRAIEEGKKEELPHAVYVRSFVKSSGLMLGIPAEELAEMLAALSEGFAVPKPIQSKGIMESQEDGGRWRGVLLLVKLLIVALIAVGAYMGYTHIFRDEVPSAVRFDANSTEHASPVTIDKSSDAAKNQPAAQEASPWGEPLAPQKNAEPAVTQVTSEEALPAEKTELQDREPGASESLDAALAAENAKEEKKSDRKAEEAKKNAFWLMASPAGDKHLLEVKARGDCWIEVHADKEGVKRQKVLPGGKNMVLTFQNRASLRLGNTGAVDIFLDGKKQKMDTRKGVATLNFPD